LEQQAYKLIISNISINVVLCKYYFALESAIYWYRLLCKILNGAWLPIPWPFLHSVTI